MSVRIVCTCELYGERFSPLLVGQVTGLTFTKQNEVGDLGSSGRYRGVTLPYGSATISVPKMVEEGTEILWLAKRVMPHIDLLRDAGADDIRFDASLYHDGRCDWALSAEEFQAMAILGIRMNVSVHEES